MAAFVFDVVSDQGEDYAQKRQRELVGSSRTFFPVG
jgi:hypothetical protein